MESRKFIVFLKNKTSLQFEYKSDVSSIVSTQKGYVISFNNGREYNYRKDNVRYYRLISTREPVRIYEKGKLNDIYYAVDNYGKYLIFRNNNSSSSPIENRDDIEICCIKQKTKEAKSIIDYFECVLSNVGEVSFEIPGYSTENKKVIENEKNTENKAKGQICSEILLKAIKGLDLSDSRSALSKYIDAEAPAAINSDKNLIYPFGCNESQKMAVETVLSNSMSIVEGPPGTGKTQTILNIIANLIMQNKTVAVVSNNNSAVFNVREKLEKYGCGSIAASLGNDANKALFFDKIENQEINPYLEVSKERLKKAKDEVIELESVLTTCFRYRNKLADLKIKLSDAKIEYSHLKAEQPLNANIKYLFDKKFYKKWNFNKSLKFKLFLSSIDLKNKLPFINKLRLFFEYGLFGLNSFNQHKEEMSVYINHKFYELYIDRIENEIIDLKKWLDSNDEKAALKRFVEASKEVFNGQLFKKYNSLKKTEFNAKDYRRRFDEFIERFPVILSSTLLLHASVPKGYLVDYLIIDESSQVDIIKAAVCFSCCRNVAIVGDSMQLAHIVENKTRDAVEEIQKKYRIPPEYDYLKKSVLSSLKTLYGDKIKSVLLKEHYRCHPKIIGFCNKKYYNNELVIMTEGSNNPFKVIETSISGARKDYNQRQIDESEAYIRKNYSLNYSAVGVVAPYRRHAEMLQAQLPDEVKADTIHKFQGLEKDVIIFNTVRKKVDEFFDNPNLINVAVSRAVKEFIVVKPESMELPHGTNIGDLIRYIAYNADPKETFIKGSVCSVFDILYQEYNKVLIPFLSSAKSINGSPAEMIIYKLLDGQILKEARYASVSRVREYSLKDLIRDLSPFSEDETQFIRNNSRLDFLLYNKIDKTPILAIEVDGSLHDSPLQKERDAKKNHILETIGLPLLRLSTSGKDEKAKIIESLNAAMGAI